MTKRDEQREQAAKEIEPYLSEFRTPDRSKDQVFRDWSISQVLLDHDPSGSEIQEITEVDGPGEAGIDGWHVAKDDEESRAIVTLIQCKDTKSDTNVPDDMIRRFTSLFDRESKEFNRSNQAIKERATELKQILKNTTYSVNVHFWLTTSQIASKPLRDRSTELAAKLEKEGIVLDGVTTPATFTLHDIIDLRDNLQRRQQETIDVKFKTERTDYTVSTNKGSFKTVQILLRASIITDWFNEHRSTLFQRNLRFYQGRHVKVNKQILDTLKSDERLNFHLYNNGITAIAQTINIAEPGPNPNNPAEIRLRGLQIVNGCQTTAILHHAQYLENIDLNNVYVQCKIIEAPDVGIADLIAQRTNSQTAMRHEDFRSTEQLHHRLQKEFDQLQPPWFYDYKRGEWSSEVIGRKTLDLKKRYTDGQFAPRKVGMKDLAQAAWAFIESPSEAMEKPKIVFENDDKYRRVFAESVTAKQLLFPFVMYRLANEYTAERKRSEQCPEAPYLRYPMVFCVGRVLASLGKQKAGLLDGALSMALVETNEQWWPVIAPVVFDKLMKTAGATDGGLSAIRSLVRTKTDWIQKALDEVTVSIQAKLNAEREVAEQHAMPVQEIGLRKKLPFNVN